MMTDGGREVDRTRWAWMVMTYHEKMKAVVVQQLIAKGFEYYTPMTQHKRRLAGCRVLMTTPLYPGIMFIRWRPNAFTDLGGLVGKLNLFQRGASDSLIQRHMAREVKGLIHLCAPAGGAPVKVADRLQTLDGFMDLVVTEVLPRNRIRALTYLLGREHEVVVDLDVVSRPEPANDAPQEVRRKRKKGKLKKSPKQGLDGPEHQS